MRRPRNRPKALERDLVFAALANAEGAVAQAKPRCYHLMQQYHVL